MNRPLYLVAGGYVAICGALLLQNARRAPAIAVAPAPTANHPAPQTRFGSGAEWFAAVKPNCNALEVEVRLRDMPPPASADGAGYGASCLALAGKIDSARALINRRPANQRGAAAGILFDIAHPVADAGDNQSSGPMMELVLEYWPENYMALYHAGMSEFALQQPRLAKKNLRRFLELYQANDGWRSSALSTLGQMGDLPAEKP